MKATLNPKLLDVVELDEFVQGVPTKRKGTIIGFREDVGLPSLLIEVADSEGVPIDITSRTADDIKTIWSSPETATYRADVPEDQQMFENGLLFLQNGSVLRAKECFARAFTLDPKFVDTLSDLTAALADKGGFDSAVVIYLLILELRPDYGIARDNLAATFVSRGIDFVRRGLVARAIDDFNSALLVKPSERVTAIIQNNLATAYTQLGVIHTNLNQYQEATGYFLRAFEIRPFEATAKNLALALIGHFAAESVGRPELPKDELFRRAMQVGLTLSESLNAYGATLAHLGWTSEAQSALESAVEADSKNELARANLNRLLEHQEAPGAFPPGLIPLDPQPLEYWYS